MAASQDGEPMPEDARPGHQLPGEPQSHCERQLPGEPQPGDWAAWYALGSERVGRHGATAPDLNETLLLPPLRWHGAATTQALEPADRQPDLRPAGRHASVRGKPDPGATIDPTARPDQSAANATSHPGRASSHAAGATNHAAGASSHAADRTSPAINGNSAAAGDSSKLRLVWVYPDLLSTYGDRGNLLVLSRRARLRGIEVEPVEVNSDQPVPRQGDIYLLGGGEDLPQILAANRLRADGGLAAAADRGAVIFAVCAGYQLLGDQFGGVEGEPVTGLGVLDISSGRGERRGVG